MEQNNEPEALDVANQLENGFITLGKTARALRYEAAETLRRLHARVQELEGMLESVGAGGVSAQRVTQGKDHFAQPIQRATTTVVLPEPIGTVGAAPGTSGFTLTVFEAARVPVGTNIYTEQQVRELLAANGITQEKHG